jgi:4'-phosphopantetheinyl transferase
VVRISEGHRTCHPGAGFVMDVYWLEQSEADVPAADDWLSASEAAKLNALRFAKRRADWRLGRWTAKRAVAACLRSGDDRSSLNRIEISAAATGQPEVTLVGRAERVTISISHRSGIGICAVAFGDVSLGCDLEVIEARSDAFIADYFTLEEQATIAQMEVEKRSALVTLLWSAKESVLKALHLGLRADTRSVRVETLGSQSRWFEDVNGPTAGAGGPIRSADSPSNEWRPLQVHCADDTVFHGWWQCRNDSVRTIVAAPAPATPRELKLHAVERHMQTATLS